MTRLEYATSGSWTRARFVPDEAPKGIAVANLRGQFERLTVPGEGGERAYRGHA